MKKKLLLVLLMLFSMLPLSGCWSSHEVNTLGLSVCIGIDKGKDGYIISEQVINPRAIASKRATNESPVAVYTAEGGSIQETITKLTSVVPRKIYSSHLRMVIFGEDVAKDGIHDLIDYFLRYHEYRTDFYFAIAKESSAKDILNTLTPIEAIPGIDMFNKLKTSHEEWAPTKAIKIIELANELAADGINPVITGIELTKNGEKLNSTDILTKTDDYTKMEFTDLGAFQKDKLVGWLNEDEAKGYNYVVGEVTHTAGYAEENGVKLSYDVLKAKSKIKASVENNQPSINVEVKIEYTIVGVKGELDVSKLENMDVVNKMAEDKLTKMCEASVKKAKELKADIFGFGERIHSKDAKYWKTVKDNWNEIFADTPVNIKVTSKFVSTGDITKSLSQKE